MSDRILFPFTDSTVSRPTLDAVVQLAGSRDATLVPACVVIVPRRDPSALAGALESLLHDPARRAAQAAAAAKRLPRYEIANVAAEFGELYERLVAQAKVRRSPRTRAPNNGPV